MSKSVPYSKLANIDWHLWTNDDGSSNLDQIHTAMLIDISRQLRRLNATLDCRNTQAIPGLLRHIAANTKPKPKRKAKK